MLKIIHLDVQLCSLAFRLFPYELTRLFPVPDWPSACIRVYSCLSACIRVYPCLSVFCLFVYCVRVHPMFVFVL